MITVAMISPQKIAIEDRTSYEVNERKTYQDKNYQDRNYQERNYQDRN